MKRQITVLLALVASVGIAATAHAQTKKAFTIGEVEILDKAAYEALTKVTGPEIQKAGGRGLNTTLGKIIPRVGEAPKAVIIVQWDSLEKAQAYLDSAEFKSHAPQRDKAYKAIRVYYVEANNPDFTGFTLQGSKPTAYWLREFEVTDQAAYDNAPNIVRANSGLMERLQEANRQTGRQASGTATGKVVARTGEAPKHIALQGFPSVEQAEAYQKAATSALSQLPQTTKIIREYIVEAAP
jgi:uncharacterized protein (DUF1330 family)